MNTVVFNLISILTAMFSFMAVKATHWAFCRLSERWAGQRYDGMDCSSVRIDCPVGGRVWLLDASFVAAGLFVAATVGLPAGLSWLMPVGGILAGVLATIMMDTDDQGNPFIKLYQRRDGHYVDPFLRHSSSTASRKPGDCLSLKSIVEGHGLSDSIIGVASLDMAVQQALANLAVVAPGHDPLSGHRPSDPAGKSRFLAEHLFVPFLGAEVVDGFGGAKCLVVTCGEQVGTEVKASINEKQEYRARRVHGSLQFVGVCDVTDSPTSEYTLVFTPEDFRGRTLWVLASAYPGRPDPIPDMAGLNEGAIMMGWELLARNITRAIPA